MMMKGWGEEREVQGKEEDGGGGWGRERRKGEGKRRGGKGRRGGAQGEGKVAGEGQ